MQDAQVVDEMHIARLRADAQLGRASKRLEDVKGFELDLGETREAGRARVRYAAEERGPVEIDDQAGVVVEEDGAAVEVREGERPVGTRESPNDVGTSGGE
jgi:hypothetical protein